MAVTAKMVKELREMTGAGMMDCKKALVETDGNIEAAVDLLKEKDLQRLLKRQEELLRWDWLEQLSLLTVRVQLS